MVQFERLRIGTIELEPRMPVACSCDHPGGQVDTDAALGVERRKQVAVPATHLEDAVAFADYVAVDFDQPGSVMSAHHPDMAGRNAIPVLGTPRKVGLVFGRKDASLVRIHEAAVKICRIHGRVVSELRPALPGEVLVGMRNRLPPTTWGSKNPQTGRVGLANGDVTATDGSNFSPSLAALRGTVTVVTIGFRECVWTIAKAQHPLLPQFAGTGIVRNYCGDSRPVVSLWLAGRG